VRPANGVTVSIKDRHPEHHAVTMSTKPTAHVLIHCDVYVLKFSDG
jgi:phosphotransferase system IIA component